MFVFVKNICRCRDLAEKYRQVLDSILTFGEDELVEGLKVGNRNTDKQIQSLDSRLLKTDPSCRQAFIEAIVNENVSLVISRQLLSEVAVRS